MARRTGVDAHAYGLTVSTAGSVSVLLLETGDGFLTESGDRIVLE